MTLDAERKLRAKVAAEKLVNYLRQSNCEVEERDGLTPLPDSEYERVSAELQRRFIRYAR